MKAKKITLTQSPPPPPPPPRVVIDISYDAAVTLHALLGKIGGVGKYRDQMTEIWDGLEDIGIVYPEGEDRVISGSPFPQYRKA